MDVDFDELIASPEPSPFAEGLNFDTLDQLKNACRAWAVKSAFEFKTVRASKTRYEIVCKIEGCPWRLYATSLAHAAHIFRIKKYNANHSCLGMEHSGHQQASAKFICDVILEQVKTQPRYRPSQIVIDIKLQYKVDITYSKAFRAKELALERIHGSHADAYRRMPKYCSDIEKTNPNSVTKLECTSENQFKRVFIAYGACATGLAHCRPLLGLDGTHLKTRYQGILLTAVAVDANGQLFPVAYAVVNAENDDNWLWMLNVLHQVVENNAPHFLEGKVL